MAGTVSSVNEIDVVGRLIARNEKKNGDTYITVLSKNGTDIYVHFLCPKGVMPECRMRKHIKVKGYTSSHSYVDQNGKNRFAQTFIAEAVSIVKTRAEEKFGVQGIFFPELTCNIYMKGILRNIIDEPSWVRLLIETDIGMSDRRSSSVRLSMKRIDRQPKLKKGDVICITGSLSTPEKEIDGKITHFEDIIVTDIGIAR